MRYGTELCGLVKNHLFGQLAAYLAIDARGFDLNLRLKGLQLVGHILAIQLRINVDARCKWCQLEYDVDIGLFVIHLLRISLLMEARRLP